MVMSCWALVAFRSRTLCLSTVNAMKSKVIELLLPSLFIFLLPARVVFLLRFDMNHDVGVVSISFDEAVFNSTDMVMSFLE